MDEEKTTSYSDEDDSGLIIADEALIDEDWKSDSKPDFSEKGEDDEPDENDEPVEQKADQSFKLKYLGQEIEVSKEEMVALAQKGRDYDRIRKRADELSDALQKSNGGQQQPETAPSSSQMETNRQDETQIFKERRNREIPEFLSEYKDVDPGSIPSEVWDSVRAGKSLLSAFQSYENKNLKALIDAEKKNYENRLKTAGSRQSPGGARARGEIEDDWYKDD